MTAFAIPAACIDREGHLGSGRYGDVWKAVDEASGTVFACKASQASLRLERPLLRYESRVLQLLQGHRSIPRLLGYHHVEHFEFLGLELLGKELRAMLQPGHALKPLTVLRVGEQLLSALEHLYAHNIVHRDIKPANILVSSSDSSRIVLIDFGIARRLSAEEISSPGEKLYDPFEDERHIMGTPDWCPLNAYEGRALRPRDDLESLGYVLFFLFFGDLPWRGEYEQDGRDESCLHSMTRIRATKEAFSGMLPFASAPSELNELLRLSQTFTAGDLRTYLRNLRERMCSHIDRLQVGDPGPFDWDPVSVPLDSLTITLSPSVFQGVPLFDDDENVTYDRSLWLTDSYCRMTHDDMFPQKERDNTLTLMADEVQALDSLIPTLGEIRNWNDW